MTAELPHLVDFSALMSMEIVGEEEEDGAAFTVTPPAWNQSSTEWDYVNETYLEPEPYPDFTQIPSVRTSFIIAYVIVMVLSVVGNCIVCCTVFCNCKMHTAVNYYIVNLAICDFMVGIFVLPVKLLELTAPASWRILNDGLCTALMYTQTIVVFASVLTLVAVCIERYLAVVHPLESRMQQSKSRAKRIVFFTWIVPCLVASPFLYPSEAYENTLPSRYGVIVRLSCFITLPEKFRVGYYTFLFVFIYLLPLLFIAGTCFRVAKCLLKDIPVQRQGSIRRQEANRRKVAKMVLMVVLAFALAWTPYFLVSIVTQYQRVNFMEKENYFFTMLCINLFAFINSCVNPFIYCAMSTRFRSGFIRFFRICFCTWAYSQRAEQTSQPSLSPRLLTKRATGLRRFQCQVPMACLVAPSSSDSGSGGHSGDSIQKPANTHKTSLLSTASNKLKCKVVMHYVNASASRKPAVSRIDLGGQRNGRVGRLRFALPPMRLEKSRENSASANDVSILLKDTCSFEGTNRGSSEIRRSLSFSAVLDSRTREALYMR